LFFGAGHSERPPVDGNLNQCRPMQALARLCITKVNAPGQPDFLLR
jgi:hypothetical protein